MMSLSMVLMESGSRLPRWVERDGPGHLVLVAQHPGESLLEFARRAVDRLVFLEDAPLTATLVCNSQGGVDRNRLRETILRAVMGRLQDVGRGHAVLVADGDYSQRRILAELASRLSGEIGDSSMVSLRYRALARAPEEGALRVA